MIPALLRRPNPAEADRPATSPLSDPCEETAFRVDLDEQPAAVTADTKLICLTNPNNPIGGLLDENALRQVARIAERVGAYVLCDEVYRGPTTTNRHNGFDRGRLRQRYQHLEHVEGVLARRIAAWLDRRAR